MANFSRFDYSTAPSTTDAAQYQYMDIGYGVSDAGQQAVRQEIANIHAADPSVKLLDYLSAIARPTDPEAVLACVKWDPTLPYGGVPTSWFLHTPSGAPLYSSAYGGMYLLDFSNPSVQQACLTTAVAHDIADGDDGTFWDGISTGLFWANVTPGTCGSPMCQSDAAWQAGMDSFLTAVDAGLHAHHLISIGNISGAAYADGGPAIWQRFQAVDGLDGAMEEAFATGTNGKPVNPAVWKRELADEVWSELNGKALLANADVADNESLNTYGLATLMLAADGHSSWDTASGSYAGGEFEFPEYMTARALGAPTGAYNVLPNGVYVRMFVNGVVLVNPSATANSSVRLGGYYTGTRLTDVSLVRMGPNTGLILTRSYSVGTYGIPSAVLPTCEARLKGSRTSQPVACRSRRRRYVAHAATTSGPAIPRIARQRRRADG